MMLINPLSRLQNSVSFAAALQFFGQMPYKTAIFIGSSFKTGVLQEPSLKKFFLLIFLAIIIFPLWGEYYYPDDPELKNIIHLTHRMGKVLPFSSFPVHGSDILDYAESLLTDRAVNRLNDSDFALLEQLIEGLEKQKEGKVLVRGGFTTAYEHRFSTGEINIDEMGVPNAEDFRRAYLNFPPMLSLYAAAGTFDGIYIAGNFGFRPSWENDFSPMNNFFTKVDIRFDITDKGILAWNGNYFNLSVSRDTVHWGNPLGSTFYPSVILPYMDSLRLNVPLGPFSFDYMLASIMPKKAGPGYKDVDSTLFEDYGYDNINIYKSNPLGDYFGFMKDLTDTNPSVILVAAHRFEWNFGKIKTGAGGVIVYARSNNQFLITDILPVMIYHNADSAPNNLSLILDAQWAFFPGFCFSAMLGLDDLNAKSIGIPDGQIPTIPGMILQLEYSMNSPKLFQSYIFEAGYTHYLWGNFAYTDDPKEWYGVHLARAIYRYNPGKYAVLLPLTSPYGPGALWFKLKSNHLFSNVNLNIGSELLFLAKKNGVNLVDTPYRKQDSLNGFDQLFVALDIPVTYKMDTKAGQLEFFVSPSLFFGTGGTAFECTLGVQWRLEGSKYFGAL